MTGLKDGRGLSQSLVKIALGLTAFMIPLSRFLWDIPSILVLFLLSLALLNLVSYQILFEQGEFPFLKKPFLLCGFIAWKAHTSAGVSNSILRRMPEVTLTPSQHWLWCQSIGVR